MKDIEIEINGICHSVIKGRWLELINRHMTSSVIILNLSVKLIEIWFIYYM